MSKDKATVLYEAKFDPKLKTYMFLSGCLVIVATVVGIPFLPFWLIFGMMWANRHYESLSCTLTRRALVLKSGVWFRTHKTIPLDKITDLAVKEGPLLNAFGICSVTVETAGQSTSGVGNNANLTGIIDPLDFRNRVFEQQDKLSDGLDRPAPAENAPATDASTAQLLAEIRDTLVSIDRKLDTH